MSVTKIFKGKKTYFVNEKNEEVNKDGSPIVKKNTKKEITAPTSLPDKKIPHGKDS